MTQYTRIARQISGWLRSVADKATAQMPEELERDVLRYVGFDIDDLELLQWDAPSLFYVKDYQPRRQETGVPPGPTIIRWYPEEGWIASAFFRAWEGCSYSEYAREFAQAIEARDFDLAAEIFMRELDWVREYRGRPWEP